MKDEQTERLFDRRYEIIPDITGEDDIFFNNKPFDAEQGFMIKRAGSTIASPNYIMVREKTKTAFKSIYLLEYITDGVGYIETENNTQILTKGTVCLVRRRTECVYYVDKKTPYSKYWIAMSGTVIAGLLEMYDIDEQVTVIPANISDEFVKILQILAGWVPSRKKEIYRQVLFLIMQIFNKISLATAEYRQTEFNLAYEVRRLIDDSLGQNSDLVNMSERFNYSQRHINRVFKETFHMTPRQYDLNQKMEYARYLLASGKHSMQEISEMLGYCDVHYFMNVFKKTQNETASDYRKRVMKANEDYI